MNIERKNNDKRDCFAWLSEKECNALSDKQCCNCSFYVNYKKIDYDLYKKLWIPKNQKIERNIISQNDRSMEKNR